MEDEVARHSFHSLNGKKIVEIHIYIYINFDKEIRFVCLIRFDTHLPAYLCIFRISLLSPYFHSISDWACIRW